MERKQDSNNETKDVLVLLPNDITPELLGDEHVEEVAALERVAEMKKELVIEIEKLTELLAVKKAELALLTVTPLEILREFCDNF